MTRRIMQLHPADIRTPRLALEASRTAERADRGTRDQATTTSRKESNMKTALLALVGAAAIALLVPLAAQARGGEPVSVTLDLPVAFTAPTSSCPGGRAHYGISDGGQSGTGLNCIESVEVVACPYFCQEVTAFMKLTLPAGRINGPVTLHETFTCTDPLCLTVTVVQIWEGTVTHATGAFRRLTGAPVDGGGTAVLDSTTFEFLDLDEVLVIG